MQSSDSAVKTLMGELDFDPSALKTKYLSERDKRIREDGNEQYIEVTAEFSRYVDDPYVRHFARPGRAFPPLINRGYHARVTAVRAVVDAFLDARLRGAERVPPGGASDRQIVSIGAGFDTTYFRLRAERRAPASFVEIDHEEIVRAKARVVSAAPELRELCEGARGNGACARV